MSAAPPHGGDVAAHLAGCRACAGYAARLARARRALGEHHAGVEPDAAFASRVVAALPTGGGLIGWAALRILPAALALVLVLAGWCLIDSRRPADLYEQSATDDLLDWVLQQDGEAS